MNHYRRYEAEWNKLEFDIGYKTTNAKDVECWIVNKGIRQDSPNRGSKFVVLRECEPDAEGQWKYHEYSWDM